MGYLRDGVAVGVNALECGTAVRVRQSPVAGDFVAILVERLFRTATVKCRNDKR